METYGTPVARTVRMRERPAPTTTTALQHAAAAIEASAPVNEPRPHAAEAEDGLDKYDISTLHCTE